MSFSQEKFENCIYDNEKQLEYCEDIVELNSNEIFLNEVLELNNQLKSIKVDTQNMPMELDSILNYVEEKDFVLQNIDEVVFTPILKKNGEDIDSDYECLEKNTVFIKTRKKSFGTRLMDKDEVDMFDELIYEAKRIENLTSDNEDESYLSEKKAIEKQLEVVRKFKNSFENTNTSTYLKKRIEELENRRELLTFYNRT